MRLEAAAPILLASTLSSFCSLRLTASGPPQADDLPYAGAAAPFHGPNLWPSALPDAAFRSPVEAYHAAIKDVAAALRVLVCEARHLLVGRVNAQRTGREIGT